MSAELTLINQMFWLTSQVFGRTIICEDLATAAQYTRSHNLNSVTLEGDRVDRKGALSGGFHDVRKSRLDSAKGVKKWQEAFTTDSTRAAEVKSDLTKLEQQISAALGQIQVLEAKRKQILDSRNMVAITVSTAVRDEEASRARLARLETALSDAQAEMRDAKAKRAAYEDEKKSPMTQKLSNDEIAELDELTRQLEDQKKALIGASKARQDVSYLSRSENQLILRYQPKGARSRLS